jgi:nucleoside 2-deoxyribosyltransferase
MGTGKKKCFVVMPFKPEYRYFYLYLSTHLKEQFGLEVERGDDRIEARPIAEKVRSQIRQADVILGDVTGANPNVFYELGLADAWEKQVFLLTQDDVDRVPVDVRAQDLIRYSLADEKGLRDKLDKALSDFLWVRYKKLYERGEHFLKQYNKDTGAKHEPVCEKDFELAIVEAERTQTIPDDDVDALREFLLPRIMGTASQDMKESKRMQSWLVEISQSSRRKPAKKRGVRE